MIPSYLATSLHASKFAKLSRFQDFLQSIFHALLCALAIAERSIGGMMHGY